MKKTRIVHTALVIESCILSVKEITIEKRSFPYLPVREYLFHMDLVCTTYAPSDSYTIKILTKLKSLPHVEVAVTSAGFPMI